MWLSPSSQRFFHMQEWKKRWTDGHSHIDPTAMYDTFRLSQDGIHPLVLPAPAAGHV